MKKNAFTLAEVLITLVIIGVIAAMTIPTLMGSTNNQEIKTALKKSVSAVNQAVRLDKVLYGSSTVCAEGINEYDIARILKNHMSVIEDNGLNFKTADGMIYTATACDNVDVDVNGSKGNGDYDVDVFSIWVLAEGQSNPRTDAGRNLLFD